MVVSVGKATSTDYYTGGGGIAEGAESYYLDAVATGEPAGQWAGSGAAQLGLTGEVDPDQMHQLYGEFVNPRNGEPIGRGPDHPATAEERLAAALAAEPSALPERIDEIRRQIERTDRKAVIGWDATFSVAKSVTVAHTAAHRAELAAIRSGDLDRAEQFRTIRTTIEDAIHEANDAMLAYAETLTTSRTGGGAGVPVQWTAAPGVTVARFFQHTSRNIDPQLHIHNVFLNRAICTDGKARSLDGQDLLANKHALGAVADRVLFERLTAAGFESRLRPDGATHELTVVPTAVADQYSSRSRQITARVAGLVEAAEERRGRELNDLELYRLKRQATLATRAAKTHAPETTHELLDRWEAELTSDVGTSLGHVADAIARRLDAADGFAATDAEWSPAAVIDEAVAACGEKRSAWRRSDLMLEISLRLPPMGLAGKSTIELLDRLTDQALTGEHVQQVAGRLDPLAEEAAELGGPLASLLNDPFTRPTARLYATQDALAAEEALRQSAITRGRHAADADEVAAWIDQHCPSIGGDQRAAVEGIASSDAALSVLVGPAGTGKSFAAGAFAGAWHDTTGGRVVGLAVSQVATMVLRDDGIEAARNVSQWLDTHDRLAAGSAEGGDREWALGPRDVVMVDEASMVATADLARIRGIVDAAGARLVLTGDPHQLGAVEAGGVMGLLDGHAETYTLAEVRRFDAAWERAASLDLRERRAHALAEYDRHGRLVSHDDNATALDAAARAAAADRLDGRSVVVVTGTNEQAAAVAARVRAQLVDLGLVEEDGVLLGRDGCIAGVGDVVACRRNDYGIAVTNRVQYRVTDVGQDGSLTVEPLSGNASPLHLPAEYVEADVQLGYASTAHAAQGLTVDSAHLVTDGSLDAAALYVAMTRGRLRNTAHVATSPDAPDLPGGLDGASERPSAVAVLEGCLERDASARAATVEQERDDERLSSMALLAGQAEAVTRQATRDRMERQLDDLVANGVLDAESRARLCADRGSEHLSRLLRAVEQTGRDPKDVLREAVETRGLADADSVAQVLSHRITGGRPMEAPQVDFSSGDAAAVPGDVSDSYARHLEHLNARIDQRRATLGAQVADERPTWALDAFGPVPADGEARDRWEQRAGIVAGHREAIGWDDETRAIGTMPGVSATEKRASFVASWEALGRPESGLDVAAMTDGQLRVRVRAAEAEEAWAPPHADESLRAAETAAEEARQTAALLDADADAAERTQDVERAERLRAEAATHRETAAMKAASAADLTVTAEARARWAAASAVTRDYGHRSFREMVERGIEPGTEPDRTTHDEWAAAHREAVEADDAHRPITETDLSLGLDEEWSKTVGESSGWDAQPPADADAAGSTDRSPAHERVAEEPTSAELDIALASASLAITRANDRASADAAHSEPEHEEIWAAAAEADRQRRDAADLDAAAVAAARVTDDGADAGTSDG